jgi:hypothetical protein
MWNVDPVIFEDEDEEALKANFVRLSALYPQQGAFDIAAYVFKNQRDPEMRGQQAAMIWTKDLEIQERIREARLNGGNEPSPIPTKEQRLRQLQALFEDPETAVKDKIGLARLIAEIQGEIVKAIDKSVDHKNKGPALPAFIIAQYKDD